MVDEKNKKEKEKSSFEQMAEDIKQIRMAFVNLSKLGITNELMEIYIQSKTKLPKFKIRAVLDAQKEFLNNAIKK